MSEQLPEVEGAQLQMIARVREGLSQLREIIKNFADERHPVVGPELMLAVRAIEDARMRLGIAEAYGKELDPWSHTVPEKNDIISVST